MAFSAQSLAGDIRRLVSDPDGDRWDDALLAFNINAALYELIDIAPSVNAKDVNIPLAAGAVQQLPDEFARVHKLHNTVLVADDSSATEGEECYEVDMDDLTLEDPRWRSADPEATVCHYMIPDPAGREFYVYPPQPAQVNQNQVRATVSAYPAEVVDLTADSVDLHPRHRYALGCLTAGMLLQDETDEASQGRSDRYKQLGYSAVGAKYSTGQTMRGGNRS